MASISAKQGTDANGNTLEYVTILNIDDNYYHVGLTDEEYVNIKEVLDNEGKSSYKLNQNGDIEEVIYEGDGGRQQNEIQRINNETTRKANETQRKINEGEEGTVQLKSGSEIEHESNGSGRLAQEQVRVANEQVRVANEANRVTAENARNNAEEKRNKNFEKFSIDFYIENENQANQELKLKITKPDLENEERELIYEKSLGNALNKTIIDSLKDINESVQSIIDNELAKAKEGLEKGVWINNVESNTPSYNIDIEANSTKVLKSINREYSVEDIANAATNNIYYTENGIQTNTYLLSPTHAYYTNAAVSTPKDSHNVRVYATQSVKNTISSVKDVKEINFIVKNSLQKDAAITFTINNVKAPNVVNNKIYLRTNGTYSVASSTNPKISTTGDNLTIQMGTMTKGKKDIVKIGYFDEVEGTKLIKKEITYTLTLKTASNGAITVSADNVAGTGILFSIDGNNKLNAENKADNQAFINKPITIGTGVEKVETTLRNMFQKNSSGKYPSSASITKTVYYTVNGEGQQSSISKTEYEELLKKIS